MRERIRKLLRDYELDGIIIVDQFEIIEFFDIQKSYNFLEISPLLLITKDEEYLFVNKYNYEEFKELKEIKIFVTEDIFEGSKKLTKEIKEIIRKKKINRVGVFEDLNLQGVKTIRISNPFIELFTILSDRKIEIMKGCINILKRIYDDIKDKISSEYTEIGIRNLIDILIYEYGAEKRGYPTRIISAKRTSNPNSITEGKKIEFPVIVDFGIITRNIGAGISRTFVQDVNKEFLNNVIELENAVIDYIKPGRICSKIYDYYINTADKMGLKDLVYGSISKPLLPYSKGVYIHPFNENVIQPGSYFHINIELLNPPEFGIKIIDIIAVHDNAINLTKFF